MDHLSEIPSTPSHMLDLFRVCDHYRDVEGCSELLGGVQEKLRMTLQDVEDFLQHCSASISKDHDSAIVTPDDGALDIANDHASDATLTIFSDVASSPARQAQHQENHTDLDLHEACSLDSHRKIAHKARTDDHRAEPQDHHLGTADRALNPPNSTEICTSITPTGRTTVHASSADLTERVEDPPQTYLRADRSRRD